MAQATAPASRTRPKDGRDWGLIGRRVLQYGALLLLTALFVAPLIWMLSTSFKTNAEAIQSPPTWIPQEFSTEGYETLLRPGSENPVLRWFFNSMIAATAHTVLVLVTASMAAYALARMSFPGKRIAFALIISTLFIPPISFFVPNYLIVDSFGWLDTLLAVIVPGAAGAFGVFFLRQFFTSLPIELEEAAMLDGANRYQIFFRIILPLSKPPLATLAVLTFLANWNDFLWPVYVLFNSPSYTLPPGLAILQGAFTTDYAVIMAGGVIASVPVLVIFLFAQRYIIEGVARSGLKG
jgi:multiple sugar transport system permease protein